MTSVPPTQPPAAPETDVRLREALHRAFHDHWGGPNEPLDLYADSPLWKKQAEAVERIVAERVRVVEGERDELRQANDWNEWACRKNQDLYAETLARAASAEAAHEAVVERVRRECDFAEEHARHVANDEVLVEVGLIRHALLPPSGGAR